MALATCAAIQARETDDTLPEDSAAHAEATDLAAWNRGPVRYLLGRREEKEFRSLRDDASRSLFIREFWKRRDPDPTTPLNEARVTFWRRVSEANETFRDTPGPGWKTDRGRIYILLGPPDNIQQDLDYPCRVRNLESRGLLRWLYSQRPVKGRGEPNFPVAFCTDESGEWRLTTDPALNSRYFDLLTARNRLTGLPDLSRLQSLIFSTDSELSVALDLANVTAPVVQDDSLLLESVATEEFYGGLPISVRWDFYPGRGDGRTLTVATVFVRGTELSKDADQTEPRPIIIGRLQGDSDRVDLQEGTFEPARENQSAPSDGTLMYQSKALVPPGARKAYVGLFDPLTYRAGKHEIDLEVPSFAGPGIMLTPLTPARSMTPVSREADLGYELPFVLGSLRVVPRLHAEFPNSGDFAVYFQIVPPPGETATRLELKFFRIEGEEQIPAGAPQTIRNPEPVQGWAFPLAAWPAGTYRLLVSVEGGPGSEAVERSLDFEVVEGSVPAGAGPAS